MSLRFFPHPLFRRLTCVGMAALTLWPPVALRAAVKPSVPAEIQTYLFEYTPDKTQATLADFLKFVRKTSQGLDGLRAQYLVAELFMQGGDYKEASKIFQGLAAVALNDEFFNISVLQKLADCYLHLGYYKQANEAYASVSKSPLKAIVPEALLGQAVTSLALGESVEAYQRLQELVTFNPVYKNQVSLMLPMGLIPWENRKYDEALEYFLKNDKSPACLYFSALCHRFLEKDVDSMALFKKVLREHPRTPWAERAKYELGEVFYQEKDYPLSYETFGQIQRDHPQDMWEPLALYRLACTDMQVKRYPPAEDKLRDLYNNSRGQVLGWNITYLLTESLAEQKKLGDVVEILEEELKKKNKNPDVSYRLIWALAALGEHDQVLKLSNDFLNSEWDTELIPKTLLIQAHAYSMLGRVPESVASCQLVIDHFPQTNFSAKALQLMALSYFRARQYIPVITQVNHQWNNMSRDVQKNNPETLFWISESHLQMGNGEEARAYYQRFLDLAPPDHSLVAQALLGQAVSHAVDKDFETAILTLQRTFQTAQEKDDKTFMADVMLETGNVFFNSKDYENAAASYRQYQKIEPKHPKMAFSFYQEGLALHRAEYYSDAVTSWEKLAAQYPKSAQAPEGLFRMAKTRFDMGKYPEAVKDYQKLISSYPKSEYVKDARLQIGQCYYNAGDFTKASVNYTDFLNRYPDDDMVPQVLQLLQTCYYQGKKTPAEIEKLTEKQIKSPVLADVYWEEGAKLYNEKKYENARHYFEKILFEFPSSTLAPQAAFYRAESFYLQEKYSDAIPLYVSFLANFPEDAQKSLALFHLAVSQFNQKVFADSAASFKDFAQAYPDDPMAKNATLNAALCYAKALDVDNAIPAYENYVKLYPDSEDVGATYLQMGQLLEKFGQDVKAADIYRRTPSVAAEYGEALFNAGRVYRRLGKTDGEQAVYEELQRMSQKDDAYRVAGLLQLAEIYLTKNDIARATAVYGDVLANGDEQSKAAAQQQLQTIQGGK